MVYLISLTPNLSLDYVITDATDYIPYFMTVAKSNLHIGIGEPKFFSFNIETAQRINWGYKRPGKLITSFAPTTLSSKWRWNNYNVDESTEMYYMSKYRGDLHVLINSLFLMQVERNVNNILLIGVVKESNAIETKKIFLENISYNIHALNDKLRDFIEIWIADDFDIPNSKFPQIRNLYRRTIRRSLIDNGLRIKLKPRAELNALIIKREIKFPTIDSLNTKIITLCQQAAVKKVLK